MKTVTSFALLLLAVATVAHPYSPYTDHKEDSKGERLSEEAVAAYLKSKLDKENREPAKIVEYVETLIHSEARPTTEAPDPVCVLNEATDMSLNLSTLEKVLNTFSPDLSTLPHARRPSVNILTPDHGRNVYVGVGDHEVAYQMMLASGRFSNSTSHIWANYSPCRNCAHRLLNHTFKLKEGNKKPTLHVARVYSKTNNLSDIVQSVQCLAKLKHEGFEIETWNLEEFIAAEGTPLNNSCAEAITTAYGRADFTSAYMDLEINVKFIKQLGDSPHASSWC